MGKNILFVDDEPAVLKAFRRSFMRSNLTVLTAEDGPAALDILARENIDIIISDMRMPTMDGHQLLRKVKELYPATTRLILSGYADETDIDRAISDGSSKMYLLKPWDNKSLTKIIFRLLDFRDRMHNRNLLAVIDKLEARWFLPRAVDQLTEMISRNADRQQIAKVIEEDPVLTGRVLQMINSAFDVPRTDCVEQAIGTLELLAVRSLVLVASLCGLPTGRSPAGPELLWRHASLTNRLVNGLYPRLLGQSIPYSVSVAGLLHDIGRIALAYQMPAQYDQITAAASQRPGSSVEALEREIIGVSHEEVGGYLLDRWNMPQPVIECALFHHEPFNEKLGERQLVAVVHIASCFALQMLGSGGTATLDAQAFAMLNSTEADCRHILRAFGAS